MATPTPPSTADLRARLDGRAGALAALLVLFLDLLWRVTLAAPGVPATPESVVAAIARLTPVPLFGWATETFGSLAQNTLWTLVLIGIVAVGYIAGRVGGRWVASGRLGAGAAARLRAAAILAAILFLFIAVVVLPLAREGFFAAGSAFQGAIVVQALLFAAIWALAWAALTARTSAIAATPAAGATTEDGLSRRMALRSAAAAGLAAGVAVLGWRLARAAAPGDVAAQQQAAADIAARARSAPPSAAVANPASSIPGPEDLAPAKQAAPATAVAESESAFAKLEAEGKLTPLITSVADFYHVSKNISDPVVSADGWSLSVAGKVAKPLQLSYDELMARPTIENITTLCCISNELNGDLISTAQWTGFPLRELLEEAGVDRATVDIVFHAADGYEDSIPFTVAMDPTTLVVTGINGEPLPPDHGFPARIIVPPIYGMKNVKWLDKIEAVDSDFKGYWEDRGWSDTARYQIWARIDTPGSGETLQPGPAAAAGVASAGDRGILRVEVSLDNGATWADATLEPSINPNFTWV
ncbi:MAG TPA: molybdopterin-dependent oxidoreductase, partial [Thermomicrobiaceae bacterium]|nr:molybdopterin-dependent oxidoreductase [Thermomicrobiaceae bacterium]